MGTITTVNPANGEKLSEYAQMGASQAGEIIEACHEAFLQWRSRSLEDRASIIAAIGETLTKKKTELALLMTTEMGKMLAQSESEIDLCAAICKYTAENGPAELASEERELEDGGKGIVQYAPIGVIYGIQPWNYPCYQVIRYAIANLMAGNGVLLKHASSVTGTGLMLEQLFREAGLPENLFRTLVIDHDTSDEVINNDRIRGVTLTGSADAGKMIAQKAGKVLKKTVLELGSNDAYIVLEDADLELAVEQCVKGRIYNNGETCIAAKRFIVVDAIYDKFEAQFVQAMKDLKVGEPTSEEFDMGPMVKEDLRDKLHQQVTESLDKGASLLCGGEIPDGDGFYYPPTVLGKVKEGQPAYDDELFGPVASLIRVKDEAEAMQVANDSRFGLGGGIFTKDVEKARRLAEQHFDTGMVFVNSFGLANPSMPFGGVKNSGYGREHGGFGVKEFVNIKAINIPA